ncbi:MAG: 2-amino-4-hydroxy-6-hydroxymethyldihydropteridine diphosphokinase [Acidobacteriaceae bacterium]|nr:2-amino-4-hydroxy-6-hydroxymethyldihydropteridine diphosphokinase [Acidobacteriaceae bacterium]
MSEKRVFLALGSNLGNREQNLENAISALEREHVRVVKRSSVYETEPQDVADQPWFLNMVAECETRCFPLQLLAVLLRIERDLGRIRSNAKRRGPRVIDLDIVLYGNVVMDTPQLTVPHPRLTERRFVLEPLLEIEPDLKHPETKEPLSRFLRAVSSQKIRKR